MMGNGSRHGEMWCGCQVTMSPIQGAFLVSLVGGGRRILRLSLPNAQGTFYLVATASGLPYFPSGNYREH